MKEAANYQQPRQPHQSQPRIYSEDDDDFDFENTDECVVQSRPGQVQQSIASPTAINANQASINAEHQEQQAPTRNHPQENHPQKLADLSQTTQNLSKSFKGGMPQTSRSGTHQLFDMKSSQSVKGSMIIPSSSKAYQSSKMKSSRVSNHHHQGVRDNSKGNRVQQPNHNQLSSINNTIASSNMNGSGSNHGNLLMSRAGIGKHQRYESTIGVKNNDTENLQNQLYQQQQLQTQPNIQQYNPNDPEQARDFKQAYFKLVEKVYQEGGQTQGLQNLLITEEELRKMAMRQQFNLEEFRQRNIQTLENKQQKTKILQEMIQTKEMQECTFKPQTYSKKQKRNFEQFLKDQLQFQESRQKKQRDIKEQENIMKQQELTYQPTVNKKSAHIVGELKKKTQNKQGIENEPPMYSNKGNDASGNVHERLHNIHHEKMQKQIQRIMEMPTKDQSRQQMKKTKSEINFFSGPTRDKSSNGRQAWLDDHLYNDAKKRSQAQEMKRQYYQKIQDEAIQSTKPPTAQKSIKYAAQKFEKEFYYMCATILDEIEQQHDIDEDMAINLQQLHTKFFNYVKLGQLLTDLGYVPPNVAPDSIERELLFDMWNILSGEDNNGISVMNIKKFLLAVQGINLDYQSTSTTGDLTPKHESNKNKSSSFILNTTDENGHFKLTPQDVHKIFLKFKPLYINRMHYIGQQKRYKQPENQPTFRPQVSKTSEILAMQKRKRILSENREQLQMDEEQEINDENVTRVDLVQILTHQNQNEREWIESLKKMKEDRELEECTFKPRTIEYQGNRNRSTRGGNADLKCNELYQRAKAQNEKRDKTREEYEYEKAKEECTFNPNTHFSQRNFSNGVYAGQVGKSQFNGEQVQNITMNIKGYQKVTERQKKGREDREKAKAILAPRPLIDEQQYAPLKTSSNQNYKGQFSHYAHNHDKPTQSKSQVKSSSQQRRNMEIGKTQDILTTNSSRRESGVLQEQKNSNHYEREQALKALNNFNSNFSIAYDVSKSSNATPRYNQQSEHAEMEINNDFVNNGRQTASSNGGARQSESESSVRTQRQPLLYVDVNLGPTRSERIIVYDGDTAESLAEKFALKHNLDQNMTEKLTQLLDSQISGLLEKIDEEQNSIQSENI